MIAAFARQFAEGTDRARCTNIPLNGYARARAPCNLAAGVTYRQRILCGNKVDYVRGVSYREWAKAHCDIASNLYHRHIYSFCDLVVALEVTRLGEPSGLRTTAFSAGPSFQRASMRVPPGQTHRRDLPNADIAIAVNLNADGSPTVKQPE